MLKVLLFLVAIALAGAFRPAMGVRSLQMKMDVPKVAVPPALAAIMAPATAFAAEGTGRALGFDSFPVVVAAIAPTLLILPLYLKWSSQQEGDDFFDGYEKRRQG